MRILALVVPCNRYHELAHAGLVDRVMELSSHGAPLLLAEGTKQWEARHLLGRRVLPRMKWRV